LLKLNYLNNCLNLQLFEGGRNNSINNLNNGKQIKKEEEVNIKKNDAFTKIGNYYVKPYNLNSNNSRSLTEENDRIETMESDYKEKDNLNNKKGIFIFWKYFFLS